VKDLDGKDFAPIMPALISLIFCEEDAEGVRVFSDGIARHLGLPAWRSISDLADWLMLKVEREDQIPNPCLYVLAFYELYRELLAV
jgi:hypothetical protein